MKNKILNRTLILLIFVVRLFVNCTIKVTASESFNFKNITIEEGLSQGTVETIIQDEKGYMWIGTNDGLNRYNGYSFTIFRHERENENSIVNNYIVDLKEDKQGNIWVGTANGVSKIEDSGKKITNYINEEGKGNLSHYNIGDILILKSGHVLVGTNDGLNLYEEEKDSFRRILDKGELTSELIYSLDEDEEGNLWIGTNKGLNRVSKEGQVKQYFQLSENSIAENKIYKVFCNREGIVWVGTNTKGAFKINTKTGEITNYYKDSWGLEVYPGEHVRNFYRDSIGVLWISTNNGLIKYVEDEDKFYIYTNKVYDKRSLVNDSVFVVTEDRSGTLWVGTYGGISTTDVVNDIIHLRNDPFNEETLNDNMIHGIYEDNEGLLWVGTNTKGVNILNEERKRIEAITMENNDDLSSNKITVIKGYGDLIFLGTNNGLNIVNKKEKTLRSYKEDEGLLCKNVKRLFVDSKGLLWVGTTDAFYIFNIERQEFINVNFIFKDVGLKDYYSGAIYEDREGIYWFGSFINGGLIRLDPKNGEIENYKYEDGNLNSLADNSVRTITEDNEGRIWIGTSGGLSLLNKEENKIYSYTVSDGLPNNTIYGILIDEDNNPWVSTNLGISCYKVSENKFLNLNISDGLQSNEFNGEAYLKTKAGEFIFGGVNGINILNPSKVRFNNNISQVEFDEFSVNGIKVENIDGKKFKHDENNISFQVFLPEYNHSSIRYFYNLDKKDGEWILMDTNEVVFSKLSPGEYTFRIRAINSRGGVSEENRVTFKIKYPIWISFQAIVLYLIIILLIIRYERKKVSNLDRLVDTRTKDLRNEMEKNTKLFNKILQLERSKNNYFINLSHELRTPLNVLHSTEQLITKLNSQGLLEKSKLDYYMDVIRRNNVRLLNLINNLIDISKIEHGKYSINKREVDIVYLVEEAALSLKNYAEEKGIDFIIDPQMEEKIINCDPQDIERCIVNLIGNAIKFTSVGGEIIVIIEEGEDSFVKIIVKDNGIGISKEDQKFIFNRFNQVVDSSSEVKGGSGLGLTITKQIINLHGGKIYVISDINKGSQFVIELPEK